MKYTRLSALALAGALTLSLAACSPKEPDPSETPDTLPTESVEPVPTPDQGPATADGKVSAAWQAIEGSMELPAFQDLDDDLLSSLYYLDAGLLDGYIAKIPMMNVHATEFFIAKVKEGNMDAVKEAVGKRQADMEAQWSQYLPEQLELVKNYKLVESGDYLLFCVCDDPEAAVAAFEGAVAEGGDNTAVLAPDPTAVPTQSAQETPAQTQKPVETQKPEPTPAPQETEKPQETPEAALTAQGVYEKVAAAGGISGFVDTSFALDAYYSLTGEELSEYVLYMPDMSTDIQEVFVARAAAGKLETVKSACQSRQQGLKEQAEFYTGTGNYIDGYQLLTQGDWVLFYVGPNAEGAANAFTGCTK